MSIEELVNEDSSFNESKFIANVDNTFIMMLSAIITNNLKKVDHKIGDKVYETLKTKLDALNSKGYHQMYDELNVKSTNIISIDKTNDKYIIKVRLVSRYMDYIVDKDYNYVSGNNTSRVEIVNILTFEKNINSKEFGLIKKCPTCGASIDYNGNGECSYCHNVFNTEDYDYILTDIER